MAPPPVAPVREGTGMPLGGRGVGLRPRLTLVSTGVVALVSALLLWLGRPRGLTI